MTDETKGQYLTGKRGTGLLIALLAALTVLIAPAAWAGQEQAAAQPPGEYGTWAGQVKEHARLHYDYVGAPCPTEVEFCPAIIVTYKIVPTTVQAREALPRVAGHRAELTGTRYSNGDSAHQGTLYVSQVKAG